MNAYIFERSIEMGVLLLLALCFVSIMVVALYDIRQTAKRQHMPRVLRNQPHITVLVYAKNNADTILATLKSCLRSTYRHYDIVMVDDGSKDATFATATSFQAPLKNGRLRVFKKRKVTTASQALHDAYRKSKKGELVMVIGGDTVLTKMFLRECAGEYRAFPAAAFKLNTHYEVASSLKAVVPRFQQLGRHLQMKITSLVGLEKNRSDDKNIVYTRKAFLTSRKSNIPISYRGQLAVQVLALPKLLSTKRDSLASIVGIIVGLALMTYAGYVAFSTHNPTLLLFTWLSVCLWFLGALWLDEAEKTEGKVTLTFTLPPLYIFMYITGFIQLISVPIKTFFNRG